jgi:glucan 1,3-beta-glucosidase
LRKSKGKKYVSELIRRHRDQHITKGDFEAIRGYGLNAVRLPIGYWVLLGPSEGEPYEGPALEYVDRAVDWAEACGLQIVLDLHGCPGGESGEAPCGRRQRPDGTWKWKDWRFEQSLEAVEVLASRYHKRKCVTGIAVCNEPSNEVPNSQLCRYYEKAILRIRAAGMPASRVAVVCPLFQRDEDSFIDYWVKLTGDRHRNVCFDVHCYHCFENFFNGLSFAQQLRYTEENAKMLHKYPMVVGEWSLALGVASWSTCGDMQEDDILKRFASTQLEAFKEASHGTFFWNWTERDGEFEWNFQEAALRGLFSAHFRPFPAWISGSDPLEEELHPSPSEGPHVFLGDSICLRTFYGRYVDVEGAQVNARWADKGTWQEMKLCPVAAEGEGPNLRKSTSGQPSPCASTSSKFRSGDIVRIQAHCGKFLTCCKGRVVASRRPTTANEFVLHVTGAFLKHNSLIYLECRETAKLVNADEEEDGLFVCNRKRGETQGIVVEKLPKEEPETSLPRPSPIKKTPVKRRHELEDPSLAQSAKKSETAPSKKRRAMPASSPLLKTSSTKDTTSGSATPAKRSRTLIQ